MVARWLCIGTIALIVVSCFGQSEHNLGVYIYGEGGLNPGSRTDIHDLAHSLTDSTLVIHVDSTKGANFGIGLMMVLNNWTIEMGMSTVPADVIGNGDFSAKYTTVGSNTSVRSDSLDLFMMYSRIKIGAGYLFNNGGSFFFAPSLNYDAEAGRMVVKDQLWERYDYNNHFTYTTTHNGVHIDSLHQDKSKIRGFSLGLRTGLLIGRGWRNNVGLMLSVAPYLKYGWRTNTSLQGERNGDPGRWSFYAVFSLGIGLIQKEP